VLAAGMHWWLFTGRRPYLPLPLLPNHAEPAPPKFLLPCTWPPQSRCPTDLLTLYLPSNPFRNPRSPSANPKYLTPSEVREVMRRMWALNEPILAYIYPTGESSD